MTPRNTMLSNNAPYTLMYNMLLLSKHEKPSKCRIRAAPKVSALFTYSRVVDAPWRHPGADVSAFFNYDHNMRTWRDYCKRVEQYRLQFTMQKKIQTLDTLSAADPAIDPDLPPELRAALAAERQEQQQPPPPRRPFSAPGDASVHFLCRHVVPQSFYSGQRFCQEFRLVISLTP